MKKYDVAVVGGDGIGPEVTGEGRKVLDAAAEKFGFGISWTEYPFGGEFYLKNGVGIPQSSLAELANHDALFLGAIGDPRIPPGPLEQEILLALRFHFDQYINLRPAENFPGVPLPVPLAEDEKLDVVVVRENTEDLYMGMGGDGIGSFDLPISAARGLYNFTGSVAVQLPEDVEAAFSLGVMTRPGTERITRYAFNLARERGEKKLTVVSKANAVPHLYGFWDKIVREVAQAEFPDIEYASVNVDAICYLMARKPSGWGVVLCPNLFGDIVSDLMSGLAGGLGLAAAANIGDSLSMFEPVHGSAPTIAGTGQANPLAAILSGAMLLNHLGEKEAAKAVDKAVRAYLGSGKDIPIEQGGSASTGEVGSHVARLV